MSRDSNFEYCPSYSIEIHGNGTVIYKGYENVVLRGQHVSKISTEKIKELVNDFYKVDYLNLNDEYGIANPTDNPIVKTSIDIDGNFKSVYECYCVIGLLELEKLRDLENKIDEITNSSQWVGTPRVWIQHFQDIVHREQ